MSNKIDHTNTEENGYFWDSVIDGRGSGWVSYTPYDREVISFFYEDEKEEEEMEDLLSFVINHFDYSFRLEGGIQELRDFVEIGKRR